MVPIRARTARRQPRVLGRADPAAVRPAAAAPPAISPEAPGAGKEWTQTSNSALAARVLVVVADRATAAARPERRARAAFMAAAAVAAAAQALAAQAVLVMAGRKASSW